MALSDDQQQKMYDAVMNIAAAIDTHPGETLGDDLRAILADFGVVPATTTAAFDPAKNPNYLGWTREVSAATAALKAAIAAVPNAGELTADQAAALSAAAAGVTRLEAFFNKGGA